MARTVLIAYDGSEGGEDALALGGVLAEVLEADVLVATVVPVPPQALAAEDFEASLLAEAHPLFDRAREALPGLEVSTRAMADGSPARALHELTDEERPTLVVLGSSRHGAVGRVLAGSVGEAMLSGATVPVAIAPRGYAELETRHLLRIGAGVAGPEAEPALEAAIGLAERMRSSLTFISVVEAPSYGYGAAFATLTGDLEDWQERAAAEALDAAFAALPAGVPAKRHLVHGAAAERLANAAEDLDLLILGSRAYGPLRRVLLGSVSARLVRSAPCAVLVLPRGAGPDPLGLAGEPTP